MKIISHRGLWSDAGEKNSSAAFLKSLAEGFGLETDVRDYMGELVVSHDIPSGGEMPFQELLEMFSLQLKSLPLAINIKSDGIARKINEELKKCQNINAFVFDMSVPDTRSYIEYKVPFFSRMSEVELQPVWLDKASGVWLDAFEYDWYSPNVIEGLLSAEKTVCVVSPELHGRAHKMAWEKLRRLSEQDNWMLCTDFPLEARKFFG